MTTHYGLFDASGKCVSAGASSHGLPPAGLIPPGHHVIETEGPLDPDAVRSDGQSVVPLPPRPSEHHRFCHVSCGWKLDEDGMWATIRAKRDRLLAASDWVTLRSHDLNEPVPPEWLAYRQALRDLPQTCDPMNVAWPVAPQT